MDAHKPRFHFVADSWMNDVIPFFDGKRYHVFFDYNPRAVEWTALSDWGHAISDDLLRWRQAPSAFGPTPGGPDQGGCWTGCVIRDGARAAALYTGITDFATMHQVQCLATSDDMLTWHKHPANPVIDASAKPPGAGQCFRDPQAWREDDGWYCAVGSEKADGSGGLVLLYRCDDLVNWRYVGVLCEGQTARTGFDSECPDFFELGGKWVLLTSRDKTWWQTGRYENHRFAMERWGTTDGSQRRFYAAKTMLDARGRRVMLGWITEARSGEAQKAAGWASVLSLPRVLSLRPDGTLGQEPLAELAELRGRHTRVENVVTSADGGEANRLLPELRGDSYELLVRFAPGKAEQVGVLLRATPDLAECTRIIYDRAGGSLMGSPLVLAKDEPLELRVFVDRSVVEVFAANGRACVTARTYPSRSDALGVGLFVRAGAAVAQSVDFWEIA
jgi:beta-fructofuranosidase